jgi:hypothetical protein
VTTPLVCRVASTVLGLSCAGLGSYGAFEFAYKLEGTMSSFNDKRVFYVDVRKLIGRHPTTWSEAKGQYHQLGAGKVYSLPQPLASRLRSAAWV